jgi:P-type conjugative transfer protein TrbJ
MKKRACAARIVWLFAPVVFFFSALPSHAIFGMGDTVFDASAYTQQLINYATQLQQYYTQIRQYQSQMRQLENEYAHLRNLGYQVDLSNLDEIQRVMRDAIGISNDFNTMQGQFERHYPDFASYRNQSGISYAQQSAEWSRKTQQNALDLLTLETKLQQSIAEDQNSLRYLNTRSNTASGTKDLLQATNQLLILQTKQLMQLQQLIATSAKADAAYMAEKASNDEASRAASDNIYREWTRRTSRTPLPKPGHVLR